LYFSLPEYIPPPLSRAGVHKHWSALYNMNFCLLWIQDVIITDIYLDCIIRASIFSDRSDVRLFLQITMSGLHIVIHSLLFLGLMVFMNLHSGTKWYICDTCPAVQEDPPVGRASPHLHACAAQQYWKNTETCACHPLGAMTTHPHAYYG
jgi:hypothetical protein